MKAIRHFVWMSIFFAACAAQAMELPEQQSADAKLFATRCSICHALPHPKRLDWPHWRGILAVMRKRAQQRGVEIPEQEWRRSAAYLKRHAR